MVKLGEKKLFIGRFESHALARPSAGKHRKSFFATRFPAPGFTLKTDFDFICPLAYISNLQTLNSAFSFSLYGLYYNILR